jgi:hypothetical protein
MGLVTLYKENAWYLDITPNEMNSFGDFPIPGKDGLPLCEKHGRQLKLKEVVVCDQEATEILPLTIVGYARINWITCGML